jgi:carbonic anhydrase
MFNIVFAALLVCLVQAQEWNYDDASGYGPSYWYQSYPTCGGFSQSPINILTKNLVKGVTLGPLTFNNYNSIASYMFNLTNIGHGVQINVPNTSYRFYGEGLRGPYTLEQLHFHWSQQNAQGSEHLIDGNGHSMEIHMVHYDASKYKSVSEALQDPQGVAVLGIFVAVDNASPQQNMAVTSLSTHLSAITYAGQATPMAPFAMQDLLPKTNTEYFRYHGSLTTPGCTESLIWTVFKTPIYVSQATMDSFRTIHGNDGDVLAKNFRPSQSLNNRDVYYGK